MKNFYLIALLLLSITAHAQKITDFSLPIHSTGEVFELKQHLGKKNIIINFFASWCTACIAELDELHDLQKKYSSNQYLFIAINAGERKKIIKKFLRKHPFNYLILEDKNRTLSKQLNISSLPQTLVVDKKGEIIFSSSRPPKQL